MEPIEVFVLMMCTAIIWFVAWLVLLDHKVNETANSPELRQCLSQSGTTWQWGECVIILNK